jgi:hypothetical protein
MLRETERFEFRVPTRRGWRLAARLEPPQNDLVRSLTASRGVQSPGRSPRHLGLAVERSIDSETSLGWREQRRGDGGGAVFAPRPPAVGLRRKVRLSRRANSGRVGPAEPMWKPRENLSPPADSTRVPTRFRGLKSSQAIHVAIDCSDLMLRSEHRSP